MPTVSAGNDVSICSGTITTLSATGSGTFQWNANASGLISSGAVMAVGLRKLLPGYTGPAIRLRRSSDNAESDFGFVGNDLDLAAISAWLGGNSGYCTTIYDQSGSGNNITQSTVLHQPLYFSGAINGKPVIRFNATQFMANNTNFAPPYTIVYGAKQTGPARERVLSSVNNNWLLGWHSGYKKAAFFMGWVAPPNIAADNNTYIYTGTSTGSVSHFYENGNVIATNSNGTAGPNGIRLNGYGTGSGFELSDVDFLDVVAYNSVLAASARQATEAGISMYPNPISGQIIQLAFTDQPKGLY
ncbi:MAG: hypothetical protein EOP49_40170, partial [Sphingobacteriales bacterium]